LNKKVHWDFLTGEVIPGPSQWERRVARRERKAAEWRKKAEQDAGQRVAPWAKLDKADYAFDWTKGTTKQLLEAGCLYEYAREALEFRCLLTTIKAGKNRNDFGHLLKQGADVYPGLDFDAFWWLYTFADELAQNTSFAGLLDTKSKRVDQSLKSLRSPLPNAINLAVPTFGDSGPAPWPWRPWSYDLVSNAPKMQGVPTLLLPPKLPERHVRGDGSEKIAIIIRWRDFKNKEIGKEMEKFAKAHRPDSCKQPRRGQKKAVEILIAHLKELSVMRLYKAARKPWKRLELIANVCCYKGCVEEWKAYKERCKQGRGDEPMGQIAKTEMSDARKGARTFFKSLFPAEEPSNW